MKASKKLISSIVVLVVVIALAATSTFAWFTMNANVSINQFDVRVKANSGGLYISLDDVVFSKTIDVRDVYDLDDLYAAEIDVSAGGDGSDMIDNPDLLSDVTFNDGDGVFNLNKDPQFGEPDAEDLRAPVVSNATTFKGSTTTARPAVAADIAKGILAIDDGVVCEVGDMIPDVKYAIATDLTAKAIKVGLDGVSTGKYAALGDPIASAPSTTFVASKLIVKGDATGAPRAAIAADVTAEMCVIGTDEVCIVGEMIPDVKIAAIADLGPTVYAVDVYGKSTGDLAEVGDPIATNPAAGNYAIDISDGFLTFYVYFMSDVKTTVKLDGGKNSLNLAKSRVSPKTDADSLAAVELEDAWWGKSENAAAKTRYQPNADSTLWDPTFVLPSVADADPDPAILDVPLTTRAAYASRVMFGIIDDANVMGTYNIWEPNAKKGFGESPNNPAKDFAQHFVNATTTIASLDPSSEDMTYTDFEDDAIFDEELITLEQVGTTNLYKGTLAITVWIEGEDNDCFSSILSDLFSVDLAFVGAPAV